MDGDRREFPLNVSKYYCGNWVQQSVLGIRLVSIKYDLTETPQPFYFHLFY